MILHHALAEKVEMLNPPTTWDGCGYCRLRQDRSGRSIVGCRFPNRLFRTFCTISPKTRSKPNLLDRLVGNALSLTTISSPSQKTAARTPRLTSRKSKGRHRDTTTMSAGSLPRPSPSSLSLPFACTSAARGDANRGFLPPPPALAAWSSSVNAALRATACPAAATSVATAASKLVFPR